MATPQPSHLRLVGFVQNVTVVLYHILYHFCFVYYSAQGWKLMLFKSRDVLISIVHTKSKELLIVDIRDKKQRLVIDAKMRTKIFIHFH